jgi:uncharacterized protein
MNQDYPFLQPAFFEALEQSGAASLRSGWQPMHLQDGDAWVPLYLKSHNRGEYVFDHGWAQAYAEHGLSYFPRLVTAVPFSPLSGPRWRGNPDPGLIAEQVRDLAGQHGASSWHLLFPDQQTVDALQQWPLAQREACHFRWFNRDYRDFEGFLAGLTSRRRKSIRRERRQIADSGLRIEQACGEQIPAHWWPAFYQCYADTYFKRGQRPYLTEDFFYRLQHSALLGQLLLVMAFAGDQPVAAAFYLFDQDTLYGRYWGSLMALDGLHFELCYYRGIEFCIERGLQEFDPGVQGEHKILRGFEPVITRSLHWMREPAFHRAVTDFCTREAEMVRAYQREARALLPYRQQGD